MSKLRKLENECRKKIANDMGYDSWGGYLLAEKQKKEKIAKEHGYQTFLDMMKEHDPLDQRQDTLTRFRTLISDIIYFLYKSTILYKKYNSGYNDALESFKVTFRNDDKIQKFIQIHKK